MCKKFEWFEKGQAPSADKSLVAVHNISEHSVAACDEGHVIPAHGSVLMDANDLCCSIYTKPFLESGVLTSSVDSSSVQCEKTKKSSVVAKDNNPPVDEPSVVIASSDNQFVEVAPAEPKDWVQSIETNDEKSSLTKN